MFIVIRVLSALVHKPRSNAEEQKYANSYTAVSSLKLNYSRDVLYCVPCVELRDARQQLNCHDSCHQVGLLFGTH